MKLTKKQAKELSLKKWEYIVSNNGKYTVLDLLERYPELANLHAFCGYCEKYILGRCQKCPINLGIELKNDCDNACYNKPHPYKKWLRKRTKANAQKVLDLIKQS